MTKEELKEAIAATITENGQKGITAESLANLLLEIVDAAGEGGGGDGVLILDIMGFEGPNENNAIIRQTLMDGIANNKIYPVFIGGPEGEVTPELAAISCAPVNIYGYEEGIFMVVISDGEFQLNEDGSLVSF